MHDYVGVSESLRMISFEYRRLEDKLRKSAVLWILALLNVKNEKNFNEARSQGN